MIGTRWIREQGMQDALLVEALRQLLEDRGPPRIMTFSRGDWEQELLKMAA